MKFSFISIAASLCPGPLAVFLRSNTLQPLLSSEYSPRRALYMAHPGLLWTNVCSDALIAISYVLFFFGIHWLVRKFRHIGHMRSNLWALSAFNVFNLSCGAMILLRIITIWYPMAQISLGLKIICAAASLPAAVIFVWRASAIASGVSRFFDLLASEHRQAEALRKSEALLDRTNRVAGIGGWELDLTTNQVDWSAETARLHGMPPTFRPSIEEGISFFAPEFRDDVVESLQKSMVDGNPWDLEIQILRRDGTHVWVRVLGEAEFAGGKPIRLFGSFQDKTKEIEQRLALRRTESLLERTNHVAGIGGWELDLITNEAFWSNETARIHGRPPGYKPTLEEGIDYFAPECQPQLRKALDVAMSGGGGWDLELSVFRADGRRIWVRLLGDVELLDGKPVRLFGSVQDKTIEVEQREAIRKSEALLERTNRVAGIGGWEFDLITRDLLWSDQTARLHGMPPGHKPSYEESFTYFPPEYHPAVLAAVEAALATGGGYELELPLLRADGRRIWVNLLGEVESVDGKPVRIFGSMQDKTEEVERREALRKSEYLLERANRIAGMGGWEVDLLTSEVCWSAEIARMHGLPPEYKPTIDEAIGFFTPECQTRVHEVIHTAVSGEGGWDVELTLIRVDGQRRCVRHLGEVELLDGLPVKLFGSLQDITEDFERREALRKSQDFLDRTNRIAGVGGWEVDIATGTVTWSAETYRLHALPITYVPAVATGISFYALQDRPIIAAAVERALETGEPWDLELQFTRADDKPIWVRTAGSVEMKDGKAVRIVGAIQDKTAQVSARLALTIANKRASLATESGGIAIWDWDLATNQFICDLCMFRLYGLEPKEGPTHMSIWAEQLHPEDRPLVISALMDAIEGIKPYDTDFRVLWADGSTHTIKATGQVIRDESGRALHMIGTNCDVTEAHRLASELAQQHELLRVTLLSIGDAVVSTGIHRQIVWMNAAAERMTGWDACDATGKPVSEVFNIVYEATRLPADVYTNPDVARARRVAMDEKVILVSREDVERNIESCATPIYDNRAQLIGSVLVIRDVTEQFQLAREMEQIGKLQTDLKLKDEFLSHVSHELRSPLTSVYSFTSIVADNLAGDTTPEQQEYLQIVLKNVLQLQSMIEDLLTVTQSKEGRLPIEVQAVSVGDALLDATNTAHPAAVAKLISITAMDNTNLPEVAADPTRLRQIMIILLDNAIKFTPEEGHIEIRVIEDGTMLRVEVEDNGCGIPLDKRARVFEKLYQITGTGHADTSQQGRIGLGLGLHIARDLVRRQGGNIWVTGEPEHGSIFNFTLPIASNIAAQASHPLRRKTDWPESVAHQLNPAA